MRVGIFLTRTYRPYSIDFDGYAAEIARSGHEPVVICPANHHPNFPFQVVVYAGDEASHPDFWKALGLERVICMTWFKHPEIFQAIRAAGVRIINRADSDGQVSARVFPSAVFHRCVQAFHGPMDLLRRLRHFVNRWLWHWKSDDAEVLKMMDLSDRIVVETQPFLEHFKKFLRFHRREDLLGKFAVVPHSVPELFIESPVAGSPRKTIFCSGRWDDDQKNAALLAASIPQILRECPEGDFLIAGYGVDEMFARLAGQDSRIRLAGLLPRESLPALLAGSRFLLSSSRWESHPIGALEALCCGCTVVATPVPGFQAIVQGGKYGTLASSHSVAALVNAVREEWMLWDAGKRLPGEIASHWRAEVNNKVVVAQLLSQ
ncbi:MAG: glycosyltransferase family 4 protein [Chthoniobacterales bacterium]|nr:glycosyltransferase family 4 protein [Chthoniobacterales bacterium]